MDDSDYEELAMNPAGRDWELFEAACKIGWAYHGGYLTYEQIASPLITASKINGLVYEIGLPATEAIIDCGLDYADRALAVISISDRV